jgi:hypothetical protein
MRRVAESGTPADFRDSETPEGPGSQHACRNVSARVDKDAAERLMERRKMSVHVIQNKLRRQRRLDQKRGR